MGRKGILRGGRVRALAAVAALLAPVLAWPAGAQVVCTGGGCGGGAVTSPVATDPLSLTGAVTFDNAANTPVTLSDGAAGGTLCSVGVADTANSVCVGSNAVTGEGATADANETVLAFGDASADNTLTLKGTASGVEATVTTGALLTGAGTGTGRVSVGGVLCKGAPAQATTGTSEQALATCAIPANTLTAAGSMLRIAWNGQTAANGNNKTVYVRIGASGTCPGTCTLIYQSATSGLNNQDAYSFATEAAYKSSTTAVVKGVAQTLSDAGATTASTYGAYMNRNASVAWTSALEVTISALTPTSAGDFTLLSYSVEVVQ